MKKIIFGLLMLSLILSCKSQDSKENYIGTWLEVKQKNKEFVLVDCGYEGGSLKTSNNSIFEKGIMEDVDMKIDHIKEGEDGITLFTDKLEKSYYKFLWIDKEKGISKWEIQYSESSKVVKYFVNALNVKSVKKIQGTKTDCISKEDVGDVVNDSLVINGGNNIILVEDDNCISLKNKKGNLIFERCFDNSIVKIRHTGEGIPLTITNGQNSMDIDFFSKGNEWISNSVTYYKSSSSGEDKNTKSMAVSLKEFDFNNVVDQFGDVNSKGLISLDDIKNKEKLKEIDVYKIADILKANPICNENIALYNDAAFNLIEMENFNEARIILLDIVNFSPDRVVAYLNLGDAQWGFDENEDAKKSYQKYISLMKTQGKDLNKIPKRVYERIK
ncbi:hypothetical protein IRZ71_10725 [Flavobacterium sp. ANB]|uniref:tetratricopeptide repeat protein n=1 Tax=unclassified Flavobacterium TaxID=196869 RepID=UPI0012B7B0D1|nr:MULTISPECIES: hypothetical protein [unclassified Flavobacterium]MBF4516823.1 hypothetical protein [Flavobacterium sp. ANB]MTD69281.1 hypothetical protein [Flavobacterium sp. LC2016-13]